MNGLIQNQRIMQTRADTTGNFNLNFLRPVKKQFKDNLTFFYCHFVAGCVEKTCPPEGFQGKDCECWCKGNPIRLCSSIANNMNVDDEIPDVGETLLPARFISFISLNAFF